jgi:hypothetical protein
VLRRFAVKLGIHEEERIVMSLRERIEQELEDLRGVRDEIEVRLHLGKLDAQDLWQDLEKKRQHAEGKLKVLGEASQDIASDVGEAARLTLAELKEGYAKLRRLL